MDSTHSYDQTQPRRTIHEDFINLRDAWMALWGFVIKGKSFLIFLAIGIIYTVLLITLRHPSFDRSVFAWVMVGVTLTFEAVNTAFEEICNLAWPRSEGDRPEVAKIKHIAASVVTCVSLFLTVPLCIVIMIFPR